MQLSMLEDALLPKPEAAAAEPLPESEGDAAHDKAPGAFKTISEAADSLEVPQHVLRFWEAKFSQIRPLKRSGGRRYYRPEDMEILSTIKNLLYKQGYTIKGAKKWFSARNQKPAEAAAKPASKNLSDKQRKQLLAIYNELVGLRDALKPYVF